MPESHSRSLPFTRSFSFSATRSWYELWETPRAAEVMTQPSCGWLSSIPSGLVVWSVVSEPTTGFAEPADAACWDGRAVAVAAPVSVNTTRARENTPATAARTRCLRGSSGGRDGCDEDTRRRCLAIM